MKRDRGWEEGDDFIRIKGHLELGSGFNEGQIFKDNDIIINYQTIMITKLLSFKFKYKYCTKSKF